MRILYDGQIYKYQVTGGINRYFSNIIKGLSNNYYPTLLTENNRDLNYPEHPNLKIIRWHQKFRPERVRILVDKLYAEAINRFNNFDIVHPTYYSLVNRQSIESYRLPMAITVYDMIHELFANNLPDSRFTIPIKRKAIMAAQAIICISENTKQDLINLYAVPEEKIWVTYLAPEIDISLSYSSETIPQAPYYVFIGSRSKYKNFDRLLSAFAQVCDVESDLKLCVIGAPFNKQELKMIDDLKLDNRLENYGYVTDTHLAKLYRNSIALVYPSLYEGFGIPPLEAMACETAVIASNCSSIPEVVGEAALLFNPESIDDLIESLRFLLKNPIERDNFIQKGKERTKLFSWEKTVSQTIDVYRSLGK
ncbi:glycosyltransferase family 4 protein [Aphanothece sacrum]|uniref:Glycosyl transferase n=1 Tax=Aphanothece sacrum FPU1 TaxID=1920663 RepID=A0A401II14_APHSA|nr:glycosyltransferase family 1 protein [Aphanothece sacrum]GBF80947.1 glycosyl transferase [Aphanothece sacrum FPU1]GBF85254.1 glycosyl transferase [Aphanothece sacrum FPU3]